MMYIIDKGIDLVDYDKHVIKHCVTPSLDEFRRVYNALERLHISARYGVRYFVG